MTPIPSDQQLERMLEQVKKEVFLGNNAAFLGSLMCSHEFHWDYDETICPDTACTDGENIWWSIRDFLRCSDLEKICTLLHELWHTALLHGPRMGSRCPDIWNIACDYRINNNLIQMGFKLPDNGCWVFDPSLDAKGEMAEEEIYDLLMKNALPKPLNPKLDLKPGKGNLNQQLGNVVRAVQAAELAKQAGMLPGNLKQILNEFLEPKIDWRIVLYRWMTQLLDELEYTWRRPNRRYQSQGLYLPSSEAPEGSLDHLVYFLDVSGSISRKDVIRFNSEVKYVKEVLKPKKLTLVQFDTRIAFEQEFDEDDPFEALERHGGGGTSLTPVHQWIEDHQPMAAIIFSDLFCDPMRPLSTDIPVIWAVVNNKGATVPFGQLIHITE